MYKNFIKPCIDFLLSLFGLIILFIPMIVISIFIYIDDPGPIFFKQKRVGKNKNNKISYFNLYKFRTMKVNTPHNVPTHMMEHPDMYITRVGKFLRKTSLDELPQIFNILTQKMAIIGPRPALWNQYDLISEREKYGANDLKPGLTGWAQINGRDELEISEKAKLDGYYAKNINFIFDFKCFIGTFNYVLKQTGIVEGKENKNTKKGDI